MRAFTKLSGYLLLVVNLQFLSCQTPDTAKRIDLDDIRPKAKEIAQNKSEKAQKDTLGAFYKYYANDSAQLGIAQIAIDTSLQTHFLDRFSTAKKRLLLTDSTSHTFQYHSWSFSDSSSCVEAFYNWLDQAGRKQQSVLLGSGDVFHTAHGFYIIAENELLFLQSRQAISYQKWLKWFEGKTDTSPIIYTLRMKPKQKTKWFQYTNAKPSPYEPR